MAIVQKRRERFACQVHCLTNVLLEEWLHIPINTGLYLLQNLPRRLEAVIIYFADFFV